MDPEQGQPQAHTLGSGGLAAPGTYPWPRRSGSSKLHLESHALFMVSRRTEEGMFLALVSGTLRPAGESILSTHYLSPAQTNSCNH